MSYPVNDHRPTKPQPEVCELCGEPWPASEMYHADIEGIRGIYICASKRTGCAEFRSRITFKDRWKNRRKHTSIGTGDSPVFPAGGLHWSDQTDIT